jgi:hypothetical protein
MYSGYYPKHANVIFKMYQWGGYASRDIFQLGHTESEVVMRILQIQVKRPIFERLLPLSNPSSPDKLNHNNQAERQE